MITLPQKETLIACLQQGMNMNDAIKKAKIPKASLYRFFKEMPAYKTMIDDIIETAKKDLEAKHLAHLKSLIQR